VEIGAHVHIQNNVSVYQGVILEDYVFCGPSMVFTNMVSPRCETLKNDEKTFIRTLVRRGATLGANCTVMCGVEIGQYAMIGAGSVVTRSVPDFSMVLGVPARLHGWVCRCGAQLPLTLDPQSDESTVCSSCQKHYIKTGFLIREI
jgi:UDP-2-acetamido-3-amino-2,3-dideoxy-glucuronate N-acetyltransferase